nr:HAMP domain-containing sensor histidine kinase [Olsenella profusa]
MGALFVVAYLLSGWALRPVERAWEQQRRFVSDASHELKTPLAVILANTQILEADGGVPKEARRWVHSTSEEVTHMKGLVEDLLTLARADEQEASGTRSAGASQAVDLSALVSGCALEFDAVAFERGCSIECALADGVTVTGDPEQLRRVVRTLLDNATKYADRGTPVRVGLSREGRRARLTVNNRGETIAPEDLAHLFDRFYRTDDARERQSSGGFGLGLAIAKSLVESMGGKISARSTDANGTTFEVTL